MDNKEKIENNKTSIVRKRRRRKSSKNNKFYFTKETEDAIIEYNKLDPQKDYHKRNKIYESKIYEPLRKIAENLIHTFKFYYFDIPPKDVEKLVVSFMTSKLDKYNNVKGKAFSYFSIVGKNWLIINNNKNYYNQKKHKIISGFSEEEKNKLLEHISNRMEMKNSSVEFQEDYDNIMNKLGDFLEDNSINIWEKERDINIALSVAFILKRHNEIEMTHKKAVYVLIKEISGEKSIYITKVLNKIKDYYEDIKRDYFDSKIENLEIFR